MKIKKEIKKKLIKDGIISLFLLLSPVVMMLAYYHIKGEKPWEKKMSIVKSIEKNK